MFTHFGQLFQSARILERNSLPGWVFTNSPQLFQSQLWRDTHSLNACPTILVSGSNLLNSWITTHILDVFQYNLITKPHSHLLESYQFALQKKLSCFTNFCHECQPHTYCQYSISLIFMIIQYDIALTFCTMCKSQIKKVEI